MNGKINEDNCNCNSNSVDTSIDETILKPECGCNGEPHKKECKCGKADCEYATDYYLDMVGSVSSQLGNVDEGTIAELAEAVYDHREKIQSSATDAGVTDDIRYHNTAEYSMIDEDDESVVDAQQS